MSILAITILLIIIVVFSIRLRQIRKELRILNSNLYTSLATNFDIIRRNCDDLKNMQKSAKAKRLINQIMVALDYIKIDREKHRKEASKL